MWQILFFLSIFALAFGVFSLGQPALGIGTLLVGGILGILSRIVQADKQHNELKKILVFRDNPTPARESPAPGPINDEIKTEPGE
jgi:hypothetical protein